MAADPRIVRYIREQIESGTSKEEIYKALLDAGWQREQINEAIYEIINKKPPEEERPEQPHSTAESAAGSASTGLVRYIKEQMDAGFRKAQIYDALAHAGWYKEEIDAAFYEVVKRSSFAPEPQVQPAVSKQAQKPRKRKSRKKIAAVFILAAAAVIAALALLGIFNPLDYILPENWNILVPGGPSVEGFSKIGVLEWNYNYDGNFSVTFMNLAGFPITINSVSAECGGEGILVVLETLEPTHLEDGANITYSVGDEKCLLKEPHESYSVDITIRYIEENNTVISSTGTVSGRVE